MGEVIKLLEQYEIRKKRALLKYRNCDEAGHRVKLANDLSRLAARWSSVVRHCGLSLSYEKNENSAIDSKPTASKDQQRRGKWRTQ